MPGDLPLEGGGGEVKLQIEQRITSARFRFVMNRILC